MLFMDLLNLVLQKGLKDTFQNVDVTVVDCPDLTQKPFQLADKGIHFYSHLKTNL